MLNNASVIFSLDPGSQRSGWAVFRVPEQLVEAGLLVPSRTRDDPAERLRAMKEDLIKLLDQFQPDVIVLEWTSGKVVRNRHGGGGAGLPIYGVAVGALWQVCEYWAGQSEVAQHPCQVVLVPENEWTRGRPKMQPRKGGKAVVSRIDIIAGLFPQYNPCEDPGGDMADAMGLNLYYQHRMTLENWKKEHPQGPARPRRKGR
jgi:hypothetical protein